MLLALNRVTAARPASAEVDLVLDAGWSDLVAAFVDGSSLALYLRDIDDGSWRRRRATDAAAPDRLLDAALPPPMAKAILSGARTETRLRVVGGPGLSPAAASGVYVPLAVRGAVVGVAALEHEDEERFGPEEEARLVEMLEPVALAVLNARWFQRVRALGAEEERLHLARELHDGMGQALAHLGVSVDRIQLRSDDGAPVVDALAALREDVRALARSVEDALTGLRAGVTPEAGVGEALRAYVGRIRVRSGLTVDLDADEVRRLPSQLERGFWGIAQEALHNVERHARADRVWVRWHTDGESAMLVVVDDGVGFVDGGLPAFGCLGMAGMRERAAALGAQLDVASAPGQGTTVCCSLPAHSSATSTSRGDRQGG